MIVLKSPREIGRMRDAGQLVAGAHQIASEMIRPGITTGEIDQKIEAFFAEHQAEPLFKGVPGPIPFPAVTCISINEQIVHGIPGERVLEPGDLVSVDTGCRIHGWCGDAAWTYPVGEVSDENQRLLDCGQAILRTAIDGLRDCRRWSQVAKRMMKIAKEQEFTLVDSFVGHGIGREMHEAPQVPNQWTKSLQHEDFVIQPGLVLAIEPMVNAGTAQVRITKDHWTAVTADGSNSVHFEHTVAVSADGPVLLTDGVGSPLWA